MNLDDITRSPHFQEHADLADPARVHRAPGPGQPVSADRLRLAAAVEDPSLPLAERLAAGGMLGLLGDPRLTPVPVTCFVPGATVPVGLPADEVEYVVRHWADKGVEESWIVKETPEHPVRLDDFWIARYPVTNGEWRDFLADAGLADRPTTWYLGAYPWDRSNHPVAGVRAEHADAYASWLSERTGHPWRLPTEAEWEYAAKGPEGRPYPWEGGFDPDAANTRESGVHTTTPVGAFPDGQSPFGAHDMGGNVEEFTADDYAPYPGGVAVDDHLTQSMGTYRVARGGGFARFGDLTRTRRRHGAFPGPLYPVGFRLATSERPS
ncbi:formylglycine-generating enzyme family protein [Streptomyces sp. G3]|uniref:Formylglycine-generating enzyme family protein n=1 Tax=Streptomyces salinarius TaxID=2762598 RepID=A0ABW8BK73_9ACTN|nr:MULTISPECIES: SUMF1/EgtB/PvdO family nonheme iron enzyme [Streptomyces]WSU01121.1 formylglycine-generating enzyme family protein [Streptomyces sp. NBC_01124]MCM1942068.1 formylglycine-generating enzyme family protein [Streptomyces sp. G3]MCQ4204548.1 formylglycine-generating enzyme family protein [Streptomyces coelicoflavus]MDU0256432.1 SUMF1/EgtB/PvdO family nonheme iron enzyme [Streptomyces sp. PU10]NDZ73771.1 formylglycine-generating enzyme family protein [Streptomyces sp. SID10362]